MRIAPDILATIGNTPLVALRRASRETGCTILGKAEFLNPGLSVKDRAALAIVNEAEKSNLIRSGGTIVERTAGNTGIGLALVAAVPHGDRDPQNVIGREETDAAASRRAYRRGAGGALCQPEQLRARGKAAG